MTPIKWIKKAIDKIVKSDQPNNGSFVCYGHLVELKSGTPNWVSVDLYESRSSCSDVIFSFTFDFDTKELSYEIDEMARLKGIEFAMIDGFLKNYGHITRNAYERKA